MHEEFDWHNVVAVLLIPKYHHLPLSARIVGDPP